MRYHWLKRFLSDERGQDLVEYALLLTCVSLAAIVVMQSLGAIVTAKYSAASAVVTDAGTTARGARGGGNPGNPTPGAGTPGNGTPGSGNPGQGGGPGKP